MNNFSIQPQPVVKWVGGKRRLLPELAARLPDRFRHYHEPFLGGGALFFALRPALSYLADANGELVNLYQAIKHQPQALMRELAGFRCDEAEFYAVRDLDRDPGFAALPAIRRAARFVYINKTCFNGLWRVNRRGQFNNAWGKHADPVLFSAGNVMAVHESLRRARLAHADFAEVLRLAGPGDFVYFDPPYDSAANGRIGYVADGFGAEDQTRLWQVCVKLHRLGAKWMLSNADTPFIRRLYRAFRIEAIQAPRSLAGTPRSRRPAPEVIVRNY